MPNLILPAGFVIAQDAWVAATLSNSWVTFNASYHPVGYAMDKEGWVHLRGIMKSGTTAQGTTLFTLPVGFRPAKNMIFPAVTNDLFASIQIVSAGTVSIESAGVSATYLSVDGIAFSTAA